MLSGRNDSPTLVWARNPSGSGWLPSGSRLGLLWRHGPAERPYPRESAAKQSPAPALTATLDYRNWTTERSEQSRPRTTEPPHLTRGRFDLTVMLPIGTEDGSFTVQFLTNNNESVAEVTGTATWNGTAEV